MTAAAARVLGLEPHLLLFGQRPERAAGNLLIDEIRAAGVPVILHPAMARAGGERENLSFTTAAKLVEAGIPVAFQSGYEGYVPKTRVVLFEAAVTLQHGLTFDQALTAYLNKRVRMI